MFELGTLETLGVIEDHLAHLQRALFGYSCDSGGKDMHAWAEIECFRCVIDGGGGDIQRFVDQLR